MTQRIIFVCFQTQEFEKHFRDIFETRTVNPHYFKQPILLLR